MTHANDEKMYAILIGGQMAGDWCLYEYTYDLKAARRRCGAARQRSKRVMLLKEIALPPDTPKVVYAKKRKAERDAERDSGVD
jgi:hypothetical protein